MSIRRSNLRAMTWTAEMAASGATLILDGLLLLSTP